jgi:peptidoglycan/xylan/chitin deacetylase (PgdA/CDA1 family)
MLDTRVADRVAWAEGSTVSVPGDLDDLPWQVAVERVRMTATYTETRPVSSRLPFSYQAVPLPLRTVIGHAIGRVQRGRSATWAAFPRFPIDLSADYVADRRGAPPSPFAGGPAPVLLSHDIDTSEGLRNLVDLFLPLEEAAGARSANYVVPCAWPIDHGMMAEVARRGHELGIHGYDHSNTSPFVPATERRRRIDASRPLVERYGMTGYRAPSLLRTRELLADLAPVFRYDSSVPTSGGLFPVPNNGCASARPFMLEGLIELPLSLPRDGSLLFLGYDPDAIFAIWRACAERIAASGGVIGLLTHCESRFSGRPAMLALYRRFLAYLAHDERYAFQSTADVLAAVAAAR